MMAGRPYRRYHVLTMARMEMWRHFGSRRAILTGAFYAGLLDGLLGVAGMIITSDYGSFPKIPC